MESYLNTDVDLCKYTTAVLAHAHSYSHYGIDMNHPILDGLPPQEFKTLMIKRMERFLKEKKFRNLMDEIPQPDGLSMEYDVPMLLFTELLNHLNIDHLDQVLGLLHVVVYNAASKLDCNSPTEPALTNSKDFHSNEAAGHPQEDSSVDLPRSLSSKAVQELITLRNTHMHGLSTGSMAGSSVIRILQTLHSLTLVDGNKSKGVESDGNQNHVTVWQELSDPSLALGTQWLLPFIEAFLDRVIARLQQPVPLEYIPVEAEYQKDFSELLQSAARDYDTLAASVSDIHWTHKFQEPPSVWRDMLRPIHVTLVSCSRYFEAMSAMRESFTTLQMLRVVPTNSPNKYHSQLPSLTDCVTPYSSRNVSPRFQKGENQEGEDETDDNDVDDTNGRRLSWHWDMDNGL
ncbi:augmin subunit 2 [Tanacetum coccineum]